MQVKKQLDMEQQTGSKLGKEYVKAPGLQGHAKTAACRARPSSLAQEVKGGRQESQLIFNDDINLQKLLSYSVKHLFKRGYKCNALDKWAWKCLNRSFFLETSFWWKSF